MPYKLVEGEVRLFYRSPSSGRHVGSRPDGDSAWFKPDNPNLLSDIGGRSADFNVGGFAQLRFEGIDALELHYPGNDHQLEQPTVNARDFLLDSLGFDLDRIEYAPNDHIPTYVRSTFPVAIRSYILTRAIDPFNRPVAFVYAGNAPERSGSDIFIDVNRLDQSLNAALMRDGHVYPAYYAAREVDGQRVGGLPGDLRAHLSDLAAGALSASHGVWSHDETNDGATIDGETSLSELAIWPKLYRRLAKYFDDPNANINSLDGFRDWLEADRSSRDDLIFVLSIGERLNLSDTLLINGQSIMMIFEPHDLIIQPR